MNSMDRDLFQLISQGKRQGYLTYEQVTSYLPDEGVNSEKLDNLLTALEERGIELVDAPPGAPKLGVFPPPDDEARLPGEPAPRFSSDKGLRPILKFCIGK